MRIQFGWEICRPALSHLHPAPQMLNRQCMNCVSAPMANFTFLQQEQVPLVSPVATSAYGAEVTDFSSHQNSLLFLSVCFTVLLGFPCDQSRASSNGPQSNFFQPKQGFADTFSCDFLYRSTHCVSDTTVEKSSSAGKLDHNFCSKGRKTQVPLLHEVKHTVLDFCRTWI